MTNSRLFVAATLFAPNPDQYAKFAKEKLKPVFASLVEQGLVAGVRCWRIGDNVSEFDDLPPVSFQYAMELSDGELPQVVLSQLNALAPQQESFGCEHAKLLRAELMLSTPHAHHVGLSDRARERARTERIEYGLEYVDVTNMTNWRRCVVEDVSRAFDLLTAVGDVTEFITLDTLCALETASDFPKDAWNSIHMIGAFEPLDWSLLLKQVDQALQATHSDGLGYQDLFVADIVKDRTIRKLPRASEELDLRVGAFT